MALTDKLTAIADAIRAKKDTTAVFTLDQMAVEIEGIVTGDNLPNAEDVSFGSRDDSTGEEGWTVSTYETYETNKEWGVVFTPNETFSIIGFRYYPRFSTQYEKIKLWDVETQTAIATYDTKDQSLKPAEWNDLKLENPVNVIAGKQYIASAWIQNGYRGSIDASNAKVTVNSMAQGNIETYPSTFEAYYFNPCLNILIGETITESEITEYKIQKTTMNEIADEVKRLAGTPGTMTPAQIITALQGIAVQTTE